MGIEISGGHFQPKLFYSSMKQIILHLSVHRCAAPFSFWEHFENRKRDRDEHDQRQSHVALSTFGRWSSGCHRRVPPAPYGMWAPVADTTLSCSGWPIQVPLEPVLMLCLAVLLIVEIKKKANTLYPSPLAKFAPSHGGGSLWVAEVKILSKTLKS